MGGSRNTSTAHDQRVDAGLEGVIRDLAEGLSFAEGLTRHPELRSRAALDAIYVRILNVARDNLRQAAKLAEAASQLAQQLGDANSFGLAFRASANVRYLQGRYPEAMDHYLAAVTHFQSASEASGDATEVARTRSSALQTLAYLARYDEAVEWAQQAREVFEAQRDEARLARLDGNLANLYFRLDRFEEALASYECAYDAFRRLGSAQDIAAVLSNLATCYISVGRFQDALRAHHEAREHSARHGFSLLVAQSDYNIAYLHFHRGDFRRAMELYAAARKHCAAVGDFYHATLCDLDQAELMLELNLPDEAARLARLAMKGFRKLEMRYERAKASGFLAMALACQQQNEKSRRAFARARHLFVAENNTIWTAFLDLHIALLHLQAGATKKARQLAQQAVLTFENRQLPGKVVVAELILARIHLAEQGAVDAEKFCRSALARAQAIRSPGLIFQAQAQLGEILQQQEVSQAALECLEAARESLDLLRAGVPDEELRIRFFENKTDVFERLVHLHLDDKHLPRNAASAWEHVQSAKSRALLDTYAQRASSARTGEAGSAPRSAPGTAPGSDGATDLEELRRNLHQSYVSASGAELRGDARESTRWRERAHRLEQQMTEKLAQLRLLGSARGAISCETGGRPVSVEDLHHLLGQQEAFIEFFCTSSRVFAFVVNPNGEWFVQCLGDATSLRSIVRLALFQISNYHNRRSSGGAAEGKWPALANHLQKLYEALLLPLLPSVQADTLTIAPHGFLHSVPFSALGSESHPVASRYVVRRTLSASAYLLGTTMAESSTPGDNGDANGHRVLPHSALVLGVPDERAPLIDGEVRTVARMFPGSLLRVGAEASLSTLRDEGRRARVIHIASHGLFRSDNPMFSAIRLGDGNLNLFELQEMDLPAELVTLSGCSTGVHAVVGGDELIGLSRGFFQAGARNLIATLWDVNDASTARFMEHLYSALNRGGSPGAAVRDASNQLREEFPHPYHWAAFSLMANNSLSSQVIPS